MPINKKDPILIAGILTSIIVIYVAGFFGYKEYKEKVTLLNRQAEFAMDKFGKLENDLRGIYFSFERTKEEDSVAKRKLLSEIEEIRGDIKDWEKGYRSLILELRDAVENLGIDRLKRMVGVLEEEVSQFKMKMQDLDIRIDEVKGKVLSGREDAMNVDLGKISVGK